jgi:hypothetical protein
MALYRTFADFLRPDGENVVRTWLDGLPPLAKIEINARLTYLQGLRVLGRPYTAVLKGDLDGLIEVRVKSNRVQYRLFGCYVPGKPVIALLVGATKRSSKTFNPPSAGDTAQQRRKIVLGGGSTCEHDWS